jgi:hypothetical protein
VLGIMRLQQLVCPLCKLSEQPSQPRHLLRAERVQALHAHAGLLHHRAPRHQDVPAGWAGRASGHQALGVLPHRPPRSPGCSVAGHVPPGQLLPPCATPSRDPSSLFSGGPSSCCAVVKCSIELGNYIHLSNYVQKAETALLEAEVRPACCVGGCPGGGGNDGWGWRGESSTCVVGTRAGGSR